VYTIHGRRQNLKFSAEAHNKCGARAGL